MARMTRQQLESIRRLQNRNMQAAVISSFTNIRNDAVLADIVRALDAGNVEAALAAININRAQFAAMEDAITSAYSTGGVATASQIGRIATAQGGSIVVRFNARSPRAEAWISQHSSKLITQIIDDQREMARAVMRAGLEAGIAPRATALDLIGRVDTATGRRAGGFIGLTNQQAGYVQNMRAELTSGDPTRMANYFSRQRRDRRLDGIVKRAMDEGRAVTPSELASITGRYNDRLLQLRGETIARTESLNSLRAGQFESVKQAMEDSGTEEGEVKKVWSATGADGRTRDDHLEMDGQERLIDEPFDTPDGEQLMFPGDDSLGASASTLISCRCTASIEADYIGRAIRLSGF